MKRQQVGVFHEFLILLYGEAQWGTWAMILFYCGLANCHKFGQSIVTQTMRGMQSHKQVDAIHIKKAFDSVDVGLLCHKLHIMGLNQLFKSFIS